MAGDTYTETNLRKAHPFLYRCILTFSIARLLLGLNYWFARPTFQPLGIDKVIAGFVFFGLGFAQIVWLHWWRDIRRIRKVLAISAGVLILWGVINCQQVLHHKASFALPIPLVTIATLQIFAMFEPPRNPSTERE